MSSNSNTIRIGTRASPLARWQAEWVASRLDALGHAVELVPITTQGDINQQAPLGEIGGLGLFTKELQRALVDGRIDLAVHSLKDLPTDEAPGLVLAATPPRESPFDALVSRDGAKLADLPRGARVGTGSLRRQSQLLHARPDLVLSPIRGNVDTRLKKLADGQFDAIVLAEAGLKRLGLASHITEILAPPSFLPAIGQGILGLECRSGDERIRAAVAPLDDAATHAAAIAERSFLAALAGGCLAPIAAWARVADDNQLTLDGAVLSPDGKTRLAATRNRNSLHDAKQLGAELAGELLHMGAGDLITLART